MESLFFTTSSQDHLTFSAVFELTPDAEMVSAQFNKVRQRLVGDWDAGPYGTCWRPCFSHDLGVTCFYLCYKDASENYTMVPAGVHPSIKLHLQIHLAT